MENADDEVRLRVLEERVHTIGRMTREAEKCCGALRGDAQRLGERVVVLEHDMNVNCGSIKSDVKNMVTQSTKDHVLIDDLVAEMDTLRSRLWWAVTIALGAVIMDLIGLIK